ncbi:MAG: leucine-rich repeat domain-containing protein, partial [Ureaplasma sp.]|nr:leucine-rich repeat domain-containing protein [Ureaplasma sp.]
DLTTLRINIQNLINENQVNSNNISSYLNNQIYNLIKDINTVGNGKLEQFITNTPTYSSNSIVISLKSDVGRYKFKTSLLTNISITGNTISLNSITLFTPPSPSPANWFTWNGRTITGLTDLGQQQTSFILPTYVSGISAGVFRGNSKIRYIDMSLATELIALPKGLKSNGGRDNGLFQSAQNLETVILPPNLKSLGTFTFVYCYALKNIKIPETVTEIGDLVFYYCSSLTSINIPN